MTETADIDTVMETAEQPAPPRHSRWPAILIVVATLIAIIAAVSTWVKVQMLDTDSWVAVSDDLLADEEVQDALATYLTNQLFERVDLQTELAEVLPENFKGLAGPLAGALRTPVSDGVDQLVSSERFAQLWSTANRVAHEKLVLILRDETRQGVSTADGTVTLDLKPLVTSVGESVGIPQSALDRIPDDAGEITVFTSDQLSNVQTTVQILDFLSWFLFILVVGLYALAVYLAHGARRRALRGVGVGLIAGGLTLLIVRAFGVQFVVDSTVDSSINQPVGDAIGSIATELLRQSAWVGIMYGAVLLIYSWLIGDHRWAVSIRRSLGGASESTGAVIGITAVVVLAFVWWSPGRALDSWVTALVMIVLVIGGVAAFFAQVANERREQQHQSTAPEVTP